MTVPETMTAAVYDRFGPPETVRLETVPVPTLRAGDVLIRVHASTVSIADYRARTRDVPRGLKLLSATGTGLRRPRHPILGMDAAGDVIAVGAGVTAFAPGDRVIALAGDAFGAHAEYLRIAADGPIARIPPSMSYEDAVAVVFGGYTAHGFFKNITMGLGATVLVNGASGAVGTAAVQLAAHQGAQVTAVTSGKNAGLVTSLGARDIIDYTQTDFMETGRTWDVIVDGVGNAPFTRVESAISPGGALLLVSVDLAGILRLRGQSRRSGKLVTMNVGTTDAADLDHLVALAESGQLRPAIDSTFDFADIVDAHRRVDTGRKTGSVVVRIRSDGAGGR